MLIAVVATAGCRGPADAPPAASPSAARNLVLITIDTLRADRVGAYGYGAARTPTMDGLARDGVRFTRAVATAPITLTSHASLMTGRYPAGHGARHNGMRLDLTTPTLAEALKRAGFSTAAFVAAFPLDRRFGLIKGFETYGDRMPRGADGRPANERPGRVVVDEAVAWLERRGPERFFLWVHLFEPHAPYGDPAGTGQRARPRALRRRGRGSGCPGGTSRERARPERASTRWSSWRPITGKRSASTARSATASSCTTRRCESR